MPVKCLNCGEIFYEDEIGTRRSHLDDDAWGAGPSWYNEAFCPKCNDSDLNFDFPDDEFETEEDNEDEEDELEDSD